MGTEEIKEGKEKEGRDKNTHSFKIYIYHTETGQGANTNSKRLVLYTEGKKKIHVEGNQV